MYGGKGRAQEKPSSAPFHHVNTASSQPMSTGLSQSSACRAGGLRTSSSCPGWTGQLGCRANISSPSPRAPSEQPEPSPQPRNCLLEGRHSTSHIQQRSCVTAHAGNSQAKFWFVPAIKNKKTRRPQANMTGSAPGLG